MYGQNPIHDAPVRTPCNCYGSACSLSTKPLCQVDRPVRLEGVLRVISNEAAQYFRNCFKDYFDILQVERENITAFLSGKHVLEYGPSDVPGVGLLMVAHGAESVICIDRFPLLALSPKNVKIMELLLESLSGDVRLCAEDCFLIKGKLSSGFSPRIRISGASNG